MQLLGLFCFLRVTHFSSTMMHNVRYRMRFFD
jgi:hypothetical protein